MTVSVRPVEPGRGIEEVARLVEESTLGSAGARQLRDRDTGTASVIRARAHFIDSRDGRSWWQRNQHDPDALRAKARELASEDPEISDVLARLADQRQAAVPAGDAQGAGTAAAQARPNVAADWTGFRDFHKREHFRLTVILCQQAGLPMSLGRKLILRAMVEAFDDWEQLAATGDPEEWVLGRAVQFYRAHRQPPAPPETEFPEDAEPPGSLPDKGLAAVGVQCADVYVTGALAAAASQVEVQRTPGTGAPRYPRRETVLETEGSAVAVTIAMDIEREADRAVTTLYHDQYRSLVRLSSMLIGDLGTAEEVVQDCFVGMHRAFWRLRDSDKALHYLRRSVVNRSRSVLRHRLVADRHQPAPEPDMPSAQQAAIAKIEQSAVISALRSLPLRQREALVLRYYLDLSEEQIASAMGISRGAVKSHTARGKLALRSALNQEA